MSLKSAFDRQDVDAEDALPITSKKAKNFGKAKRDVGLGDEERDADFDDVFDDDEEAPVTLQIEDEPEVNAHSTIGIDADNGAVGSGRTEE